MRSNSVRAILHTEVIMETAHKRGRLIIPSQVSLTTAYTACLPSWSRAHIARTVIHQVLSAPSPKPCFANGNVIFLDEEDYSAHLARHKGKLPSEVKAFYHDEQGFIVRYDDEVPSTSTRRRMQRARRELARGKGVSLEETRRRLEI